VAIQSSKTNNRAAFKFKLHWDSLCSKHNSGHDEPKFIRLAPPDRSNSAHHRLRGPVSRANRVFPPRPPLPTTAAHQLEQHVGREVVTLYLSHQLAVAKHDRRITYASHLAHPVRDEDDDPPTIGELPADGKQPGRLVPIECGSRLVENEATVPFSPKERPRDCNDLLKAEVERSNWLIEIGRVGSEGCDRFFGPIPLETRISRWSKPAPFPEVYVIEHAQVRRQQELLIDNANATVEGSLRSEGTQAPAAEYNFASVRNHDAAERFREGALARPVLANECVDTARVQSAG